MFKKSMNIADFDPELWQAITKENERQEQHIELIASENYASPRVMEAMMGQQYSRSPPFVRCLYPNCPKTGLWHRRSCYDSRFDETQDCTSGLLDPR